MVPTIYDFGIIVDACALDLGLFALPVFVPEFCVVADTVG